MNVPFFYNVPSWMIRYISGERCSECGTPISQKGIIAIGIRQHQNLTTPYVEHECLKCKHRAITSFGGHKKGTLQELCYMFFGHFAFLVDSLRFKRNAELKSLIF